MAAPGIRRLAVAVLAVALVVAATASAAAAPARAWPGATILYRDLARAGGYSSAIARAVAAWNRAGIGVRFVPAGSRVANVQIVYVRGRCLSANAGRSPLGFQRFGARIVVRSCPRIVRPLLVAHELGRVLGLADVNGTCTLMNSKGASDGRTFAAPAHCSRYAPPSWLPRLVDPLSAARARALYRPPPAALDVRLTPSAAPRLDWREPAGAAARTIVLRTTGRCPTTADLGTRRTAVVVYARAGYAGLHWLVDTTLAEPGAYCYRLFNVGRSGRSTASVPFTFTLTPAPVAAASVTSPAVHGQPTSFADTSSGTIVHWRWDFGDPAGGDANVVDTSDPQLGRAPTHTYAAPGVYTVTLIVTDDLGRSATTTIGVTVE
ncbi:MAG TPA: PKD domain-containing protein [Gaiellaceae bacterium]